MNETRSQLTNALRSISSLTDRRARLGGFAAVLMGAVITIVEMVGAGILVAALELSTDGESRLPLIGDLRAILPGSNASADLRWLAVIGGLFFVVRAVLLLFNLYIMYRVSFGIGVRLAVRAADAMLQQPFAWHQRQNSSDLANLAVVVTQQFVIGVYTPVVATASQVAILAGLLGLVVVSQPVSAAMTLVVLVLVVGLTLRLTRARLAPIGATEMRENARSLRTVSESLRTIREVKIHGIEPDVSRRLRGSRSRWARALRTRSLLVATPRVVIETAAFVLLLGVLTARDDQALTSMGLLGYVVLRVLPTMNSVVSNLNTLRSNVGVVDALETLLRTTESSIRNDDDQRSQEPIPRPIIRLQDVGFEYDGRVIISGVDLEVPYGTCVGIVGATGSGKTTLLNVMTGLLDPTSGSITAGGIPVRTARRAWWNTIAVVGQDVTLLDDTLLANIALGVEPEAIDREALYAALHDADLLPVVEGLELGLETVLGESGARLSGGQRQRVAIARALYRRPSVIFLDEATSALDEETERTIIHRLTQRDTERTLVMIAHRTSTLRNCNEIIRIEDGRIVSRGDHRSMFGAT